MKCRDCDHLKVLAAYEWSFDCKCMFSDCEREMQDEACDDFTNKKQEEDRVIRKIESKDW